MTQSKTLVPDGTKLVGDGSWAFHAWTNQGSILCGADMVVHATWFGGDNDPMDSGQTACGYATKGRPDLMGCSLPMRGFGGAGGAACAGSPFPRLPWGLTSGGAIKLDGTRVQVYCPLTGQTILVPLIDLGPAKRATTDPKEPHAIDLTVAAFEALGVKRSRGIIPVHFRILGAAKYVAV